MLVQFISLELGGVIKMKWLKKEDIDEFFKGKNYDIRLSKNARWIDQKCTPDVLTIVADCIIFYCETNKRDSLTEVIFSSMDIWHFDYTVQNVLSIFKKPNPNEKIARNEYDKFFQQPMELLAYAGILIKLKKGSRNFYKIGDIDMLNHLALRERNSLDFLYAYIKKVLSDSGIYSNFNDFFKNPCKRTFESMKANFIDFTIANTKITKSLEPRRIFTKIINPLAYFHNTFGSEKGHISKDIVSYDMLMYNRDNFRDLYADKPKGMTRKEYAEIHNIHSTENIKYYKYLSIKAKRMVREFNNDVNHGYTELPQKNHEFEKATHMHHIFSEADFPEISFYVENIIALTPTQHLNHAHPNGNTNLIDPDFQYLCLLAKTDVIKHSYDYGLGVYDFYQFMKVLNIGLEDDKYLEIENLNFDEVIKQINLSYAK